MACQWTPRSEYVRCDDGKVNYAPRGEPVWFHLVNVPLDNTDVDAIYPEGDQVQTIERWDPPPRRGSA